MKKSIVETNANGLQDSQRAKAAGHQDTKRSWCMMFIRVIPQIASNREIFSASGRSPDGLTYYELVFQRVRQPAGHTVAGNVVFSPRENATG